MATELIRKLHFAYVFPPLIFFHFLRFGSHKRPLLQLTHTLSRLSHMRTGRTLESICLKCSYKDVNIREGESVSVCLWVRTRVRVHVVFRQISSQYILLSLLHIQKLSESIKCFYCNMSPPYFIVALFSNIRLGCLVSASNLMSFSSLCFCICAAAANAWENC